MAWEEEEDDDDDDDMEQINEGKSTSIQINKICQGGETGGML
jgi:hypothetical protein